MNTHKERLWLIIAILLILVFSSIPNWMGHTAATSNLSFKGIFFDPQDYAVHMSMLRAGMEGDWAYQFRFTTEPHTAAYTRMFYIVLGQTNRLLKLDPALWFEIARWIFGALALFSLYEVTKRVFDEPRWRRIAFLLAVFGSGLGWLQLATGWIPGPITPIDFWLIDAYFFFGLALFPHFAFTSAMLCLSFAFYLDFLHTADWKRVAGIILISALTQFVNPIAFALVDVAFTAATLASWMRDKKIQWKHVAALAGIAAAQLPLLVYNYTLLTNDPTWSQFTNQNQTLSPPPLYYLWGFGLLWLFAVIGVIPAIRRKDQALIASATWIIVGLLLAYAPFAIQRRFLQAVTVPLGLLATQGLMTIFDFASRKSSFVARRVGSFSLLAVFLISLSSIYLVLGRSLYIGQHPEELYYPASLNNALTWLQDHASPDDFVLCAAPTGLLIPQKTDLRVYLGHEMETLDYETKATLVEAFFKGQADPDWLTATNVRWLLYGPYERALAGAGILPLDGLEIAYETENVIIYRVVR